MVSHLTKRADPDASSRVIADQSERDRFLERYDRYPQRVTKMTGVSQRTFTGEFLQRAVQSELRHISQYTALGAWTGLLVTVDEGDGMTWAAAAADQAIARELPAIHRYYLNADIRPDGLPAVGALISKRRILELAQTAGVAAQTPATSRLWMLALATLLLFVGALATGLTSLLASHRAATFRPIYLIVGALSALLVLASRELSDRLSFSSREAAAQSVLDGLRDAPADRPAAWQALVDNLSRELAQPCEDRSVIIDGFEQLDDLSRQVLQRYLVPHTQASDQHELWIVFEDAELATLSKTQLLLDSQPGIAKSLARTDNAPPPPQPRP
jgi:hypothetical protein